jgi:hypothetical protein
VKNLKKIVALLLSLLLLASFAIGCKPAETPKTEAPAPAAEPAAPAAEEAAPAPEAPEKPAEEGH